LGLRVAADPFVWVGEGTAVLALKASRIGIHAVDERALHGDDIDNAERTALEPYATFRSLYRQFRRAEVQRIRDDHRATVPIWFPQPANQARR
jgi:phospholipid-binding lipoprotein MlaA